MRTTSPRKCRTCKFKFYPRHGDGAFASCASCRRRAQAMTVYRLILWTAKKIGSAYPEKVREFLNHLPYKDEPSEAREAVTVFRHRTQDARLQTVRRHLKFAYDSGDPGLPLTLPGVSTFEPL